MLSFSHAYPWQLLTRLAGVQLSCRLLEDNAFDLAALQFEVRQLVSQYAPKPHSRYDHHDGGWNALGLIAHKGDPFEDRYMLPLAKTPALTSSPHIESLVESFRTEKARVRLMELQSGKSILWHYDRGESIDDGEFVRVHIPIITNNAVRVQISHSDLVWREGEIWYGDFSFPHRLFNGGTQSRVHLVLDLRVNDFILSLFPPGYLAQRERRLRVKRRCQSLVNLYDFTQLSPQQKFKKISAALGKRRDHMLAPLRKRSEAQ